MRRAAIVATIAVRTPVKLHATPERIHAPDEPPAVVVAPAPLAAQRVHRAHRLVVRVVLDRDRRAVGAVTLVTLPRASCSHLVSPPIASVSFTFHNVRSSYAYAVSPPSGSITFTTQPTGFILYVVVRPRLLVTQVTLPILS